MMKQLFITLFLAAFVAGSAFALDASVYTDYKIPEFESTQFYIDGDDLLGWTKTGDDSEMHFNLGGDYSFYHQGHDLTYYYGTNFDIDYDKIGDADAVTNIYDRIDFGATKYFGGYSGLSAGTEAYMTFCKETDVDLEKLLDLEVFAGYGRVTNAQPVAQAIAILNELGGNASAENAIAIAEIIASAMDYQVEYKDDWTLRYYGDIAKAAGNPAATMKVQQILAAAVYNISPRFAGWTARGGYHNQFLTDLDPAPKGDVYGEFIYAQPLGLTSSCMAGVRYDKSLEEDSGQNILFYGDYWYDHSYTWASFAGIEYDMYMPADGDSEADIYFNAGTNKVVLNKPVANALFEYIKWAGIDDATMAFKIGFTYYII